MVIPIVAAKRPVAAMAFLCGVIPNFGATPWDDAPPMEVPGTYAPLVTHSDGSTSWPTLASAVAAFYPDCAPEIAERAYGRLRRQNSTSLWDRPYPLRTWPPARRVAIAGTDDAAVTIDYSRHVCRRRLGIHPLELPGGHSPFLARPAELAQVLVQTIASGE